MRNLPVIRAEVLARFAAASAADHATRSSNGEMRIRIEDVAAAAGVSMKTVSRVLNNEPNVRE